MEYCNMQNTLINGFNFNANINKMDSDYKSVTEQAGIYAGNKGFDINVDGNTDLKGAVIDSTADKKNNNLDTGTITFSDIKNKAEYSTSGRGVNIQHKFGNKGDMTDEQKAWEGVTPSTGIGTKDKDESTTKSAIAKARINIMKPENQRQDITKLDRKTTRTLNKLGKIFDKDKIEEKQELAGLFQEMWHTTVGDLMAKSHVITDDQRKALNILGGAIAAELGGADIKAGLTGGVTTELLQSAFSKIKSQFLRNVAVALVAASVAKGTGQEASTAANVGVAIQKYNHDLHPEETAEIIADVKQLTGEDRDKCVKEWTNILEEQTEPDLEKLTVSGNIFGVGGDKSFYYDKKSDKVFLGDGKYLNLSDFYSALNDVANNKNVNSNVVNFSVSFSALRFVDTNGNIRNFDNDTMLTILNGKTEGISAYYGIGGGLSKSTLSEYSDCYILEVGIGTPQINIATPKTNSTSVADAQIIARKLLNEYLENPHEHN
ncbi:MAG: hypothetical protein MJ032_04120 [Acidaminococcaceae bacterium]|nr:hypothetical protein [Acidaminococcaceae bacterium]